MFGLGKKNARRLQHLWQVEIGDHVQSLAWSPDGSRLAAAAISGPIEIVEAKTGKPAQKLSGHGFGTTAAGWSHDGRYFASTGQDGTVRLWDLATGKERLKMQGGAAWVERLAWCPVAPLLATAAGKKVRLWDPVSGQMLREYADHPSTVADIAWEPGKKVLTSVAYSQLALWSPDAEPALRKFEHPSSMLVLAWAPNGQYVAAGCQDATVHFWILKTGEDLQMSGYPVKVRELSWSKDTRFLATGGGNVPCLWDFSGKGPAGTRPLQLEKHDSNVTALQFQKSGPLLASADQEGLLCLWHPLKGVKLQDHEPLGSGISQLTWSPSDDRLAVGTESGAVHLFAVS